MTENPAGFFSDLAAGGFANPAGFRRRRLVIFPPASMITSLMDQRVKHAPSHKMSDETKAVVESHIESFHPAVPHYRRVNGWFRTYLFPPN